MTVDLFAGIPVSDFGAARPWYERLLGGPPSFLPHETEAVWELDEHRYIYIVEIPEHAGHAQVMSFVDDLDARVARIADRGVFPGRHEEYGSGVRKVVFVDPDGNEVSFGGGPG
jgi:catechol 2,3-dioxygenase-like lactoylglutathione lyase family enzyme